MSTSSVGGPGPLIISPELRVAQARRMEHAQEALQVDPRAIAQLSPEEVAAHTNYYAQVQQDIQTVRQGTPLPGLPSREPMSPGFAKALSQCPAELRASYNASAGNTMNRDLALRLALMHRTRLEIKLRDPLPEGPASQNKAMENLGAGSVNQAIEQEHRRIAWSAKAIQQPGPGGRTPLPQPLPKHIQEQATLNVFDRMDQAHVALTPEQQRRRQDIQEFFGCEALMAAAGG